jgi:hypothetical protein
MVTFVGYVTRAISVFGWTASFEGVVKNLVGSAAQVKESPQTQPPDPENFHAHVDTILHNELQNIVNANSDDDEAVQASLRARLRNWQMPLW